MAGRKLSDDTKRLRVDLVEGLAEFVKANAEVYSEEQVAELTKQVQRVAKYLGVVRNEVKEAI